MLQCNLKESTEWNSVRKEKCVCSQKDKGRKYFISYPTSATEHAKAIRSLDSTFSWNFLQEGKLKKNHTKPNQILTSPLCLWTQHLHRSLLDLSEMPQCAWTVAPIKTTKLHWMIYEPPLGNFFLHISNNSKCFLLFFHMDPTPERKKETTSIFPAVVLLLSYTFSSY